MLGVLFEPDSVGNPYKTEVCSVKSPSTVYKLYIGGNRHETMKCDEGVQKIVL